MTTILNTANPDDFDDLADFILNKCDLVTHGARFQIHEIEFYLYSSEHPDIYVHRDPDQLTVGKWYFHKRGNSYRGGNYKGLDITFGLEAHGGILIRAMRTSNEAIEGPCNCVNAILKATNCPTILALAPQLRGVFDSESLRLESANRNDTIYTSARVGLSARDVDYRAAPYRYMTNPHLLHKHRKLIVEGLKINHGLDESQIKILLNNKKK